MADSVPQKKKRRSLRRFIVLALVQLLVIAGLLEVSLRFLYGSHVGVRRLLYMSGASTSFDEVGSLAELLSGTVVGYRPNTQVGSYVMNSRSLKTKEYAQEKPAGTFRVLAIGDSFTYASGGCPYDRLWHQQLEQRLGEGANVDVEVLNLGVPAVGTDFQLRLWELEGAKLDADLVVVALFVGNDFKDITLVEPGPRSGPEILADRSYLFRFCRNQLLLGGAREEGTKSEESLDATQGRRGKRFEKGGFLAKRQPDYDPEQPTFQPDAHFKIEARRMWVCDKEKTPEFDRRFTRACELLRDFHDQVVTSGGQFVLMLIPDEYQVDAEVREATLEYSERSADDFDWERPQRRMVQWCEKQGIPCLDVLPAFRARADSVRLYRLRNTHWSERGNTLASEELARFVRELGFTP